MTVPAQLPPSRLPSLGSAAPALVTPVAAAFGPGSYLRDLCDFASRHVLVAGGSGGLDAAVLAAWFRQPYDRLAGAADHEAATALVNQGRIAVEVLCRYLGRPVPAEDLPTADLLAVRDELIALIGAQQSPPEPLAGTAWRLGRELRIDLSTPAPGPTTRADQAARTLQEALIALRWGHLPGGGASCRIRDEAAFDAEWDWLGSYRTWQTAAIASAYPENHLDPALFVPIGGLRPTAAYQRFVADLCTSRMTWWRARDLAEQYWSRASAGLPADFVDTMTVLRPRTETGSAAARTDLLPHCGTGPATDQVLRELFWLVPMALGLALAEAGEFEPALGWYQQSYAYQRPVGQRRVFPELTESAGLVSYDRAPGPAHGVNPHELARSRPGARTRFTIMAIARCLLALADRLSASGDLACAARAHGLYGTAADLLRSPDAATPAGAGVPFPANPVALELRAHAQTGLDALDCRLSLSVNRPDPDVRPEPCATTSAGTGGSRTAPLARSRPRRPPNVRRTGSPPRR